MTRLGSNRYGKAEVRVVRVSRGAAADGGDLIRDWNVSSSLSGDLTATHLNGDNANVLSTDTQKNTVYAFAKTVGGVEPEAFALALAEHFVETQEPIHRARVAIEDYPWERLGAGHSFARGGSYTRTAVVVHDEVPRHLRRGRSRRSDGPEHQRLGVLGIPARLLHHPGGDEGADARHPRHRPLAFSGNR